MKTRTFLLILFLLLVARFTYAQPFYFKHYQVEEGLTNNTVFSILQDKKGFLWFGTKEGLNRFDGTTFRSFSGSKNEMQNIKGFVFSLAQGTNGSLWVGTREGLYEFDEEKELFSLIKASANTEIHSIVSDNRGKIWYTSNERLFCYNEIKRENRYYDLYQSGRIKVSGICAGPNGALWVSSNDGQLFRYDPSSDTFSCVTNTLRPNQRQFKDINRLYYSDKEGLFIATTGGLTVFDPRKKTYKKLLSVNAQRNPVYVRDIVQSSPYEFWIATESGIYIYNTKTKKTINLCKHYSDPYSISDNAVYSLYRDREGGIWSGTYFGGVNYFHKQHTYFKRYFPNAYQNSISGNGVREICEDHDGNLWIGTEDAGLNKLDRSTGTISSFAPTPGRPSVSSNNIHGLLVDKKDLWIGTFQQGLDILDITTGKVKHHFSADSAKNGLRTNFIITFWKTKTNEILVATDKGLYRYNRQALTFSFVKEVPENVYAYSLFEDHGGTVWVGTIGSGVYFFNPKTKRKGNLRFDPRNSNSLSSNRVCGIFEDSNNNLWFSTEGDGLCKLSSDLKTFTTYTTQHGLPSNMVFKVLEDHEKNLWISTSKGLAFYNPRKDFWKSYTKAHGLLTNQFNYNSAYRDSLGTMFFGSVKGLISFNPASIIPNTLVSPVYITSFQVNNQELPINGSPLKKAIALTDTIPLKYNQSSFSISFAALTYIAPEMTQYAYKLEGLDADWTYLKTNRKVYFTDLSPGDYTFRIKTANDTDAWNRKETTLVIKISPPFWLSTYAYFIYAVAALYLVYAMVSGYHNKIKNRNKRNMELLEQEKEKEIYHAKIQFFTNVAHEIRTPLTLIKGPLEMVIDEAGEFPQLEKHLRSIERNTDRLLALTNQLLDFRKTENKGFSLSFVKTNIPLLVEENCSSFASTAEQKRLVFNLELPQKTFYAFIDIEAFNKIISNLLNNAIKYADSTVSVCLLPVDNNDREFTIEVRNDGFLIPSSLREKIFETFFRVAETEKQSGSGIGLSLARSLTELHRGTLELKKVKSDLNIFVLTLPVHQEIEFNLD